MNSKAEKRKTGNPWGHMSEQGKEFDCYISENDKLILIGAEKNIVQQCGPSLLASAPMRLCCSAGFLENFMGLTHENQQIINSTLDRLSSEMHTHIGYNWHAVSNFICQNLGIGLMYNAAEFSVCLNKKSDDTRKQCYDRMNKARGQWKMSKETKNLLRCVCANYIISPEILDTGEGYYYYLKRELSEEEKQIFREKYSPKAIHEKLMNEPTIPLVDLITQLTGLDSSILDEYQLRIAFKPYIFEPKTNQALIAFEKSLLEAQN